MVSVDLTKKENIDFLTKDPTKLLRLAVVGKDGIPHISSVWYLFRDGQFYISTSEDRLKVKAIRENPKVALIVDKDTLPYRGIIAEGKATLSKTKLKEITFAIVKRYVPKKDARNQFAELMRYPRILIQIKPEKALDIMSYRRR
jgi:PPOX class probable F420-dependent enzyme